MKVITQSSLIFYLYQSLKRDTSQMGASAKWGIFTQSIQFCQCTLIHAVTVALPTLQEKFSLAWKPSVTTKHGSTYWAHLHSPPFQRKYSSPSRNIRDQLKQFNMPVACGSTALLSKQNITHSVSTNWNKLHIDALGPSNLSKSTFYTSQRCRTPFIIRNTGKPSPRLESCLEHVYGLPAKHSKPKLDALPKEEQDQEQFK